MSDEDIKISLASSRISELVAWKVGLKDEVHKVNKTIKLISKEIEKRRRE